MGTITKLSSDSVLCMQRLDNPATLYGCLEIWVKFLDGVKGCCRSFEFICFYFEYFGHLISGVDMTGSSDKLS